jgi:hypothetical protein
MNGKQRKEARETIEFDVASGISSDRVELVIRKVLEPLGELRSEGGAVTCRLDQYYADFFFRGSVQAHKARIRCEIRMRKGYKWLVILLAVVIAPTFVGLLAICGLLMLYQYGLNAKRLALLNEIKAKLQAD